MHTTDKLLDAAEFRMRRGGYNAVSFRDLASDIAIKSSSVHYHFPQKRDLGVALLERYSKRMFETLERRVVAASTPSEKLRVFSSVYRGCLVDDDSVCLGGLLGAEMAGLPQELQDSVKAFFEANIDWVEAVLPDRYPSEIKRQKAGSFVAALQGSIVVALGLEDYSIFDGITENLIACVLDLNGLQK